MYIIYIQSLYTWVLRITVCVSSVCIRWQYNCSARKSMESLSLSLSAWTVQNGSLYAPLPNRISVGVVSAILYALRCVHVCVCEWAEPPVLALCIRKLCTIQIYSIYLLMLQRILFCMCILWFGVLTKKKQTNLHHITQQTIYLR